MPLTLSDTEVRHLFLSLQGLAQSPNRKLDRATLSNQIAELGFVQVDSINTVERAHHQILYTRNQTYRPKDLKHLLEKDRSLFENWTHDASIIPSCFFPYWRHRFNRERKRLGARWEKWHGGDFLSQITSVRDHIERHGPTRARDLEATEKPKKEGGWWNWHPGKIALEYLWRTGEIAVHERQGFEKIYDLSQRILPPHHFEKQISEEAFIDWACRSALDRLGVATHGEIAAFYDLVTPQEAKTWCAENSDETIHCVEIEGARGEKPRSCFARSDIEELLNAVAAIPTRIRTLSPFDPVLRDRKRAERLFGFQYRIEVFVPEAKRTYGYYVFPLLEGQRFIGRIDMKCHRQEGKLRVKAFWPERNVRLGGGRMDRLESELARMARFTGMQDVEFDNNWNRASG
ncbi:MAG: crosslink repair DNA glycosylase YcaQ family protein [Stappiaceae bacterium]